MSKIEHNYENCEIRKPIEEIYEIHSRGCNEGLLKVTKIAKITISGKTAKFTIIR